MLSRTYHRPKRSRALGIVQIIGTAQFGEQVEARLVLEDRQQFDRGVPPVRECDCCRETSEVVMLSAPKRSFNRLQFASNGIFGNSWKIEQWLVRRLS